MTAQQAPHTPPMWRRVLSLPRTRLGWWAIGLAAPALVSLALDPNSHNDGHFSILGVTVPWVGALAGGIVIITLLVSALAGVVVGLIALARDRSLLVWVAQVPGLYIVSILASFGQEGDLWFMPAVAVFLLWAFMAFGIIWSYRDLPERRSP